MKRVVGFQFISDDALQNQNALRLSRGLPILHKCDVCESLGEWGDGWRWYGSCLDEDAGAIVKACSECRLPREDAEHKRAEKYSKLRGRHAM